MTRETHRYRPLSARRRWLIAALAVVTAITVVLTLLNPPGGAKRVRVKTPEPACVPGPTQRCVGDKSDVLPLPAPAPAGATSAARSRP